MKATTLLKNDHIRVKGLFREYSQTGDRAWKTKSRLFQRIRQELQVHSAIEEEIFYPAVREPQTKPVTEMVGEAFQDHAAVKRLLGEISELAPQDERFGSLMSELIDDVKRHAKEEEEKMFPQVQKRFSSEQLEELGRRLEDRKRSLAGEARRGPAAAPQPIL